MPRVGWPLQRGRPCIQIVLRLGPAGQPSERILLADTGAGALSAAFDLLLEEDDCLLFGGLAGSSITLGGESRVGLKRRAGDAVCRAGGLEPFGE